MKKIFALLMIMVLSFCFLLNIHIIRISDGIDIIWKDTITFRDTYADVREWGLNEYLVHSPRIRNYLLYEKHYVRLVNLVKKSADQTADSAKITLRELEENVHQWISEKLR